MLKPCGRGDGGTPPGMGEGADSAPSPSLAAYRRANYDPVMRAAVLLCTVAIVALLTAGCGSNQAEQPTQAPGDFVRNLLTELYHGQTGKAWDQLHPYHQATVSRARYIECERIAPLPGKARRVDIVKVVDAKSAIPGHAGKVRSTEVTFRVLLELPGFSSPELITGTAQLFNVDGRWAWVIGPNDYPAYARGDCPGPTR